MIVDAHQHFWSLARGDYGFPKPDDPVLYRDFLPADLSPILATCGVDGTVLVQATDTIEESDFLLELAATTEFVAGVVGWWDAREPGVLERLLAGPNRRHLVGVRPMLQRLDDAGWLMTSPALDDLSRIATEGLVFDALVDARHLPTIAELARAVPDLRIVIDHMGKPWRQPARFGEWLDGMHRLAAAPNCWVKVSGFPFSSARHEHHSDLPQITRTLRQLFGVERLIWGSDWPVVEREGGYATAMDAGRQLFADDEAEAVFGGTARRVYGLPTGPSPMTPQGSANSAAGGAVAARATAIAPSAKVAASPDPES